MNKLEDDARVAEIVGYTFWRYKKGMMREGQIDCHVPNSEVFHLHIWDKIEAKEVDDNFAPYSAPPPFLTAPTFAIDGIVLEWVQKQYIEHINTIWANVARRLEVMYLEDTNFKSGHYNHVVDYRPGMYARALLEVYDDK